MIDIIFEDSTSIPDLVQQALLRINPEYKRVCNFKILGGCKEVMKHLNYTIATKESYIAFIYADSLTLNVTTITKAIEKFDSIHFSNCGCLEYFLFSYSKFRDIAKSVNAYEIWDLTTRAAKQGSPLPGIVLQFLSTCKYGSKTTEQQITDIYRAIMDERSCTNCTKKKYIKLQDAEISWKEKHTATHAFMNSHCDDKLINSRMCSKCYAECPHIGITIDQDNLVNWFNNCGIRYACGIDIIPVLDKELTLCTT